MEAISDVLGTKWHAVKAKVSETVSNGRHASCWGTWAESLRNEEGLRGEELRKRVPFVGEVRAAKMSRRVDLPAPLGPTMAKI